MFRDHSQAVKVKNASDRTEVLHFLKLTDSCLKSILLFCLVDMKLILTATNHLFHNGCGCSLSSHLSCKFSDNGVKISSQFPTAQSEQSN